MKQLLLSAWPNITGLQWRTNLLALVAAAWLAACGAESVDSVARVETGSIEGSVLYRERMLLPPGARLEVQLEDISRADAMATVITSVSLPLEGGPPYSFSLPYDPAAIQARLRYALRATIVAGDQLMFTTTDYIDPFAGGPLQIMLYRVAEPVRHSSDAPPNGGA